MPTAGTTAVSDTAPGDHGLALDFRRPLDQLDLFVHTPAEQAAHRARRALQELAVERARAELLILQGSPGYASFVADALACISLIERSDPRWAQVESAVIWIEGELWPVAERLLGSGAWALVEPALVALVARCPDQAYDPLHPRAHASYLWSLLGEAARALAAVAAHPGWRDNPDVLLWHAQLSQQAGLAGSLLADCAELCFEFPEQAEELLAHNRSLGAHWDRHCEVEPALPIWSFPAWASLLGRLPFAAPDADDQRAGARLLAIALQLRDSGGADVGLRRAIHALCPPLLQAYLAARTSRPG